MLNLASLTLLMLIGCGDSDTTEQVATPAAAEAPADAVKPHDPTQSAEAWKILAPSPMALEAEVREAGLESHLKGQVPDQVPELPDAQRIDRVAFRTGVVFTYTLLGGRDLQKEALVGQVRGLREGMRIISAGDGVLATMDKAIEHIENDTATREDFLVELDAQVQSSVPEEGWGPDDTSGPMLQAGAWLGGINIVAKTVVAADDAEAATKLLTRPDVADFFMKYVQSEPGSEKAGIISNKVAETLGELKAVASKESLSVDDAREIVRITDELLALL